MEETRSQVKVPVDSLWHAVRTRTGAEEAVRGFLAEQDDVGEAFLPRFSLDLSAHFRAGQLLFPGYVFFRALPGDALFERVRSHESVAYLLGSQGGPPASVPESEIDFLRRLTHAPHVELVHVLPERGRTARITSGPLQGVEGVVTKVSSRQIRLRSLLSVLGRVIEISVRPDQIEPLGFLPEATPRKRRHRAGRRARRGARQGAGE